MDPEACLDAAEEALRTEELGEARERLSDYATWRRRGGFQPEGGDKRHADLCVALQKARKGADAQRRSAAFLLGGDMTGSMRQHYRLEVERIAALAWAERDEDGCVDDEDIAAPCRRSPWTEALAAITWHVTDHRSAADDMDVSMEDGFDAAVRAAACFAMIEDVRAALPESEDA